MQIPLESPCIYCEVQFNVCFAQSDRRSVSVSEFGRVALIKSWRCCQAWRSYSVPFNSVMAVPSTSCIKITHTHTLQTLAARRHGLFKALSDHNRLYLKIKQIGLLRPCANYWIACNGEFSWRVREIKLILILNVTARFYFQMVYNMGLEVNCRCHSSREGWHENVIIKAVSVSQGRRLTQNLTARLSRSVSVVDYLLPHFDTVHCLRYILLNRAATATFCWTLWPLPYTVYCWTLSTVHCQVYAVGRCLRN